MFLYLVLGMMECNLGGRKSEVQTFRENSLQRPSCLARLREQNMLLPPSGKLSKISFKLSLNVAVNNHHPASEKSLAIGNWKIGK